jgi:hypothetical protein
MPRAAPAERWNHNPTPGPPARMSQMSRSAGAIQLDYNTLIFKDYFL